MGQELPLLVVVDGGRGTLAKSFRNLAKRVVTVARPSSRSPQVVWARSVLVTEAALDAVQGRAA